MAPPDPLVPPLHAGSTAAGRPARLADLEVHDETTRAEIINGRLILSPRPSPAHVEGAGALDALLVGPFRFGRGGPGGWIVIPEPELRLGRNPLTDEPHVVIPDLAGWRRERLKERPKTAYYSVAPDWVCELLSPSTAADDRAEKMPLYAQEGVQALWLVDPTAKTLEVFQLSGGRWLLLDVHRGDAKVRAPPFDAIELELRLVWEH